MGEVVQIISETVVRKMGWVRHIGFPPIVCRHYREPLPGTGHAVCCHGLCKIHYDKVNPLADPLRHLLQDTPLLKIAFSSSMILLLSGLLS